MARIGTIIDGKYEILKQIGQGGMSKVYLAMDQRLNKQWAVKEIQRHAMDRDNAIKIQSLITEANLMKQLDHPALPRIVDILESRDVIYVIMDYIEGETLSKILKQEGAQPQKQVIKWAKQLCEVLDYLHTRKPPVVYRDMKPSNVMLKPDGNVKLIDFGIAREYKETSLEDTTSLGTRGYAAPEQFGGKGQTDARTDIYCLGATMYHLVTGKNPSEPPYEMRPIRDWKPSLSGGLEHIILKCTQSNPEDRYQSCAELLYDLNHYEAVDGEYRAAQKKKLRLFLSMAALSFVFLAGGAGGQALKAAANNNNYDVIYQRALKQTDDSEKARLLVEALRIKPNSFEAYQSLLDAYKADTEFDLEEEAQFKRCIEENLGMLQQEPGYGELAFEVGKLYWYYYDYGTDQSEDNQITRMKSSVKWFEDALEYTDGGFENRQMATVYRDIGKFNQEITLNVEEASDKGLYAPYWRNITDLMDLISQNPQEQEIVSLELYRLATNAMETYARKFKSDGITQKDMETVWAQVKGGVKNLQTTTDKTDSIKEYINNRLGSAKEAISTAFLVQEGQKAQSKNK